MAGLGTRFKNAGIETPKPLIEVDGITLAEHSINTLNIPGNFIFITRDFDNLDDNKRLTNILDSSTNGNFAEIRVHGKQLGAAHTAMTAEKYIDPDQPLIITNCDQLLRWNSKSFLKFISQSDRQLKLMGHSGGLDGAIVLYKSQNPGHSFAKLDGVKVLEVVEKKPISNDALIGVHYWKRAKDFFDSARLAIKEYEDLGYPECYISITYNYLINSGKNIHAYFIEDNEYIPLGTPEDVRSYNDRS